MKRFTLHETKNYDYFYYINGNRNIDSKKVKKLENSIRESGLLLPVLVTDDGGILDGQHRFVALRRLGLPVHYVVCNYYKGTKDIVELQESTRWKSIDFCRSNAALGNVDCKDALEIAKEYGIMTGGKIGDIKSLELLVEGSATTISAKLKNNNFFINRAPADKVIESILILDDHPSQTNPFTAMFTRTLKKIYYEYNGINLAAIERMAQDNYIKSFSDVGEQFEYMNDIYKKALKKIKTNKNK